MNENNALPVCVLEHMHKLIIESFLISCEIIVKEDLDDRSFQNCLDTIHNTLSYVAAKKKEKNVSS